MLQTQILVKNNQQTIKKTLESLSLLNHKIVIGDLGCTDDTLRICRDYDAKIYAVNGSDLSKVRNELSCDQINFYIKPGESLIQGHELLNSINKLSNIYVFKNNIISKETRIWTKEKFKNPIFETIIDKNVDLCSGIIISSNVSASDVVDMKIIKDWMAKRPLDVEPYYYMAFCYLSLRDFEKFLFFANEYCLRETEFNSSYILIKYYIAQIKLYKNDIREAAEAILTCISKHPACAEFWCLLGDIFFKQKKLNKAKRFYKNAIILGSKRKGDNLPIEINKYKEYPEKMIKNINEILEKSEIFG